MGIGEWAGLGAAWLWAISSLIYGRTRLTAWTLNLGKNLIACLILLVHLSVAELGSADSELRWTTAGTGWLALSGLIGILLGDTCYFRSLQILGARRALLLATSAPVFSAVLGWWWLDEWIAPLGILGIAVTIGGIGIVIGERRVQHEAPGLYPGTLLAGIGYGLLAAICQAAGFATAKRGMEGCDPLTATFIRLVAAALCALLLLLVSGRVRRAITEILRPETIRRLIPAAIIGTWLGIWFSQIAVLHSDIAVATTLMSTSPLFAIPLVRIVYGHPIRIRALIGTLLAIVGVFLIVYRVSASV